MARLTGRELLAHHRQFHYSRADKVREAGYTRLAKDGSERICFIEYYEAVAKLLQWDKMLQHRDDRGGADCIRSVIFYAQQKVSYKRGNDQVVVFPDQNLVSIRHHGKSIAGIHYNSGYVTLLDTKRSKSTKERLNRILMQFCGCQLYQQNHVWYVSHPMRGDIPFQDKMQIQFVPTFSEAFPG